MSLRTGGNSHLLWNAAFYLLKGVCPMRFLMVFAVTLAACFGASLCGGWVVFELTAKLWPVIVFFSLVISVPVTLLLRQSERIDLLEERIEVLEAERRSSDTPAEKL